MGKPKLFCNFGNFVYELNHIHNQVLTVVERYIYIYIYIYNAYILYILYMYYVLYYTCILYLCAYISIICIYIYMLYIVTNGQFV